MNIEVLVATMNQKDFSLIKKMNLHGDAVIINQCGKDEYTEIDENNHKIKFISCDEKGLSKSRNKAINNATGDICIIADDDVIYSDDYIEKIRQAYLKYPDADIIAFDVPSSNLERPTTVIDKEGKLGYLKSMKLASFQLTFKRQSFIENNINFNELFGAGSKYKMGEENILLFECLRKNLNLVYCKDKIGIVNHEESTWFSGFDNKFFSDMGAIYYEMSSKLSTLLILQYSIRKYKLYKNNLTFFSALTSMFDGRKSYKNFCIASKTNDKDVR